MIKKSIKILLIIGLFCAFTKVNIVPSKYFISANVAAFAINKLNQIYILKSDNSIIILNDKRDTIITRNLKIEGTANDIDVNNVFETLLFYKNINSLIFTDNLLNIRKILNFNELDKQYFQVSAICRSFDNQVWFFDIISQKVIKINENSTLGLASFNLQAIENKTHNFHQIVESQPRLFLIDENLLMILNVFGSHELTYKSDYKLGKGFMAKDTLFVNSSRGLNYFDNKEKKLKIYTPTKQFEGIVRFFDNRKLVLASDSLFLHF